MSQAGSTTIDRERGAPILLSTQTANSSVITFTSLISSAYSIYELEFYNVYPVTNAQSITMFFSTDNGATYIATNYIGSTIYNSITSSGWVSSNSTLEMRISAAASNNTANVGLSGNLKLYNLNNGALPSIVGQCIFFSTSAGATVGGNIRAVNTANTNINALKISAGAGNLLQGTFKLYGIL